MYILEAHAQDEWPIGSEYNTKPKCDQPKTDAERQAIARRFATEYKLHASVRYCVDPIANPFDNAFASWPVRFYIVQDGKLALKGQPTGGMYDMEDLRRWFGGRSDSSSNASDTD